MGIYRAKKEYVEAYKLSDFTPKQLEQMFNQYSFYKYSETNESKRYDDVVALYADVKEMWQQTYIVLLNNNYFVMDRRTFLSKYEKV